MSAYSLVYVPEPGKSVAMLGAVAVFMALRAALKPMHGSEVILWTLVVFALLYIEIRAIDKDRALAAAEQKRTREHEEQNFKEIAGGIGASIKENQKQFQATMERTDSVLTSITGGESYAVVVPMLGVQIPELELPLAVTFATFPTANAATTSQRRSNFITGPSLALSRWRSGKSRVYPLQTAMDLREALSNASQILDEERVAPTVSYDYVPYDNQAGNVGVGMAVMQGLASMAGTINISTLRNQRPREIQTPISYRFKSTNYNLLCALLSRLNENDRPAFTASVAVRLLSAPGCTRKNLVSYPGWNNLSSELPLVAEFLVRNNGKDQLIGLLWEAPRIPGHATLLRQLEEMIAFNYTLFSDSDYQSLSTVMTHISADSQKKADEQRRQNILATTWPELGSVAGFYDEIEASAKAIIEQCRKARYLYVKGLLSEGLNVEVNQDKVVVEQYIQQYGFPETLVQSLNEAERLYRGGTTPFDFKACMSNVRSFLENVHAEAMPGLHTKFGGQLPQKWGDGLAYLLQNNVLSKTEEQYVSKLYALISDEGVHPLIADKEDARLSYNTVIEYALRFFRKMERLGIKIALVARP